MTRKENKGQSLFEVVVAIGISALVITGIVSLATNSIQNSSYSRDSTLASNYVVQTNEWLRHERDSNIAKFKEYATDLDMPTWCLKDLTWSAYNYKICGTEDYITGTNFVRQIVFAPESTNVVQVNVTVSWKDSKGMHQSTSSTNLSIR
jgi:Tfp pilus assembly protein PilV